MGVLPRGVCPEGVSAQRGCLPAGCLPGGVCLGWCVCLGRVSTQGESAQGRGVCLSQHAIGQTQSL